MGTVRIKKPYEKSLICCVSIRLFIFLTQGLIAQELSFDLQSEYSINVQSLIDKIGAKIQLGTQSNFPFLRISSYDMNKDLEFPYLSRTPEFPLVFGIEDEAFTEQLRIDLDGYVVSQRLRCDLPIGLDTYPIPMDDATRTDDFKKTRLRIIIYLSINYLGNIISLQMTALIFFDSLKFLYRKILIGI